MPALLATPDDLHRSAHRIRDHATDLRHRAALLSGSADRAQWRSPAAEAFRLRVDELTVRMRTAARQLEHSADALDRHARAVSHTVHTVERCAIQAVKLIV